MQFCFIPVPPQTLAHSSDFNVSGFHSNNFTPILVVYNISVYIGTVLLVQHNNNNNNKRRKKQQRTIPRKEECIKRWALV